MAYPYLTQVAGSTPFDNSTNGFTSTDVQSAIEEASNLEPDRLVSIECDANGCTIRASILIHSSLVYIGKVNC